MPDSITIERIRSLGPPQVKNFRLRRYSGEGIDVSLGDLSASDQQTIRRLYDFLLALLDVTSARRDAQELDSFLAFLQQQDWRGVLAAVQALGESTLSARQDERMRKVIHDLRGGGFQAITANLELVRERLVENGDFQRLFYLCRDHLKIMRNAVTDVDPVRYAADTSERAHTVQLLIEKWQNQIHRLQGAAARIEMDCRYHGRISDRCLEFSALDRVLYNLLNNAVRHSAGEAVHIAIFPMDPAAADDLRFAIWNPVTPQQAEWLSSLPSPSTLFEGGLTTTGSGLGLSICADFVMNAYSVPTREEVISEGYVGATLLEENFLAWFHWPAVA